MKDSLREHIELLFENAPKTRRAFELKEELYANSAERFDDLVKSGLSEEDAYKSVVNSIGNVSELFKNLEETTPEEITPDVERIKKLALVRAAAVGLYILSAIIFLWFGMIGNFTIFGADAASIGLIIMLFIDIFPTCMLVYASSAYPKYKKQDNTMVEEFKAWKSQKQKYRALKGTIYIIIWTLALTLYFLISFGSMAWYITWVIFLIALCACAMVELIFRLKEDK